jgi:hypothetical protein
MYQTPEAWDTSGHYRAIGYMRPLAIWGMQYAWENLVTDDVKKSFRDGTLGYFEEKRTKTRESVDTMRMTTSVTSLKRRVRKVRFCVVWCVCGVCVVCVWCVCGVCVVCVWCVCGVCVCCVCGVCVCCVCGVCVCCVCG